MAKSASNSAKKKTVIFIVGPTATGKSRLAAKLARKIRGEVVSCDSMQVYRGMRVLSQAPSQGELRLARHHLVSVVAPSCEYSVATFRRSAARAIASIIGRGKVPIVAGGTGLYAKALIDGLFPSPEADLAFRRGMQEFAARNGRKRLWARLARVDAESAAAIHPNDTRRVVRALEIFRSTGRTMTELKRRTKGLKDVYGIRMFGIALPREKLYRSIDERVDRMFASGLLAEVKRLRKRKLSKTARSVLGLREISDYLDGKFSLEAAKAAMKMNTRRFAKRQLTWFRADGRILWFDVTKINENNIIRKMKFLVESWPANFSEIRGRPEALPRDRE